MIFGNFVKGHIEENDEGVLASSVEGSPSGIGI